MKLSADVSELLEHMCPDFHLKGLKLNTSRYNDLPDDLIEKNWSEAGGWIARESTVVAQSRQIVAKDDPSQGHILEAELTLGWKSLQIKRLAGIWIVTELSEDDTNTYLADDRDIVTVHLGLARYRRYWKIPANGAAEVVACRLLAFKDVL